MSKQDEFSFEPGRTTAWTPRDAEKKRRRKTAVGVILVAVCLIALFGGGYLVWRANGSPPLFPADPASSSEEPTASPDMTDAAFEVTFINVGEGDSALVVCDGQTMLIDAGENDAYASVANCLYDHGITKLDYFVLTHPHADHIGGARKVMKNTKVDTVLMPNASNNTSTYEKTLDAIEEYGLSVTVPAVGDTFSLGRATCTVLSPRDHVYEDDLNDYSLVIMVEFAGKKVLFSADTGEEPENEMTAAGDVSCDVYKVSHHGSYENNHLAWIAALSPSFAVISCDGQAPTHPSKETVELLEAAGATVYRTDKNGSVTLRINDAGAMAFETQR